MKDELRKTLENEDQRTELLHKKIREFEQIIAERDIQLQSKEKTFTKTVHKAKKLKKENKEILKHLNLIKEEYDNSLRVNELLKVENSQFKDNQLDFQSILNDKIDQITKEMKVEREKRLDEQNYARVII